MWDNWADLWAMHMYHQSFIGNFTDTNQKTSTFITFSKQDNTKISNRDKNKICTEDQE